jgi:hypothetical protein
LLAFCRAIFARQRCANSGPARCSRKKTLTDKVEVRVYGCPYDRVQLEPAAERWITGE